MLILLNQSPYFEELVYGLHECFTEFNIPHEISSTLKEETDIYLIFTTHEFFRPLPKRYISYNIEQLTTEKEWPEEFFTRLKQAECVFDYSLQNINVLKSHNIKVNFLPFGYAKCMDYGLDRSNISQKYGFIGAMNHYRYEKMYPILAETFLSNNCWKEEKKKIFETIKFGLNVHFYKGNTILEIHRIIPFIANKIFVFSEKSQDLYYDNQYSSLVTFFDSVQDIQDIPMEQYKEIVEKRYQDLITNHSFSKYIKPYIALFQQFR